jgi:hypothetical protein
MTMTAVVVKARLGLIERTGGEDLWDAEGRRKYGKGWGGWKEGKGGFGVPGFLRLP